MLNTIVDNKGSRSKFKRRGRGIGSGKGKTCGRGGKGQTARSGVALNGFEGGQMPLYRRLPKRGFTNIHKISYEVINFEDIQRLVDAKKVDAGAITISALRAACAFKGRSSLLKILGTGELKSKVSIEAHAISIAAKAKLEKNGSTVTVVSMKSSPSTEEKAESKKKAPVAKKVAVTKDAEEAPKAVKKAAVSKDAEEAPKTAKKAPAKKAVAKKAKE